MADDDKVFGMLCHLLAIFTWIIGPLVIWLLKKDDSEFIDANGRSVLNFTILATIVYVVLLVLATVTGIFVPVLAIVFGLLIAALGIAVLVFYILGTVRSYGGDVYHYPVTFAFIK